MCIEKSFEELTLDEATKIVRKILAFSWSEEEIREKLSEAGFDGAAAAVETTKVGTSFNATAIVSGPGGELITASKRP
jgi:hypothetical protein